MGYAAALEPLEVLGELQQIADLGGGVVQQLLGGFDVVASRYGVKTQGCTFLALTKLDVLSALDPMPRRAPSWASKRMSLPAAAASSRNSVVSQM